MLVLFLAGCGVTDHTLLFITNRWSFALRLWVFVGRFDVGCLGLGV